jgi:hypothetical protein
MKEWLFGIFCTIASLFAYHRSRIKEEQINQHEKENDIKLDLERATLISVLKEKKKAIDQSNYDWFHNMKLLFVSKTLFRCDNTKVQQCYFAIDGDLYTVYIHYNTPHDQSMELWVNKELVHVKGINYGPGCPTFIDFDKSEEAYIQLVLKEFMALLPELDRIVSSYVL